MKKPQRSVRSLSALLALTLLSTACATVRGARQESGSGGASQIITRQEIIDSNARNVWEALQRTVRYVHWGVGSGGVPQRGTRRGVTSGLGPERVRVIIDGTAVQSFQELTLMPARDLEEIRVLSAIDATTYFGTNSVAGAVLITTRRR